MRANRACGGNTEKPYKGIHFKKKDSPSRKEKNSIGSSNAAASFSLYSARSVSHRVHGHRKMHGVQVRESSIEAGGRSRVLLSGRNAGQCYEPRRGLGLTEAGGEDDKLARKIEPLLNWTWPKHSLMLAPLCPFVARTSQLDCPVTASESAGNQYTWYELSNSHCECSLAARMLQTVRFGTKTAVRALDP